MFALSPENGVVGCFRRFYRIYPKMSTLDGVYTRISRRCLHVRWNNTQTITQLYEEVNKLKSKFRQEHLHRSPQTTGPKHFENIYFEVFYVGRASRRARQSAPPYWSTLTTPTHGHNQLISHLPGRHRTHRATLLDGVVTHP